ncbi:MAG: hypothetical protein KC535_00690 [Nanoarchaeota archaeon]|nr:hypothetical protein [Nanoarchaeota archaeon]
MKKVLLISLVLLSTFLAACSGGSPTGPSFNPYIGGTEGVRMEFIEGQPPQEEGAILDNGKSSFAIGLQLTNVGEYDIDAGDLELELRGILPEQFGISNSDLVKELEDPLPGAKKNIDGSIIPGQFSAVSFDGLSYQPDARGDIPKTFQVNLCYDYKTYSSTAVCIADDVTNALTDVEDKEICQINGVKSVKSSGGPVQVTDLKQLPQGGNKISVIFTVSHVGTGNIYKVNSPVGCDDNLANTDRNKVDISVSLPGTSSASVTCQGFDTSGDTATGEITLWEGNPRTVTCTIEGNSGADIIYEDLLDVELSYMYGQTSSVTALIKDIGTANN